MAGRRFAGWRVKRERWSSISSDVSDAAERNENGAADVATPFVPTTPFDLSAARPSRSAEDERADRATRAHAGRVWRVHASTTGRAAASTAARGAIVTVHRSAAQNRAEDFAPAAPADARASTTTAGAAGENRSLILRHRSRLGARARRG